MRSRLCIALPVAPAASTGTRYDTTVAFTGVQGTDCDIDVQVATEPK